MLDVKILRVKVKIVQKNEIKEEKNTRRVDKMGFCLAVWGRGCGVHSLHPVTW